MEETQNMKDKKKGGEKKGNEADHLWPLNMRANIQEHHLAYVILNF